jgi:flagellar basal-body rod modification protein FlgD
MSAIPPVGSSTSANTDPTAASRLLPQSQQLGQKDFIKLLVAQLSAQDPLNPKSDTEFIGQMAQFASLQNSQTLDTEMQTMRAGQLLGKTVQVKIDDQHTANGVVTGVDTSSGSPQILIGNNKFDLSDVVQVLQPQVTSTPGAPAPTPASTFNTGTSPAPATSTIVNRGYAAS